MGKYEGSLVLPYLVKEPSPLVFQDRCEAASHRSGGRGITSGRLRDQTAPKMLPKGVIYNATIHVNPIVVLEVVTIQPHQNIMGPIRVVAWEFCTCFPGICASPSHYGLGLASFVTHLWSIPPALGAPWRPLEPRVAHPTPTWISQWAPELYPH